MDNPTEQPNADHWYLYAHMFRCRMFEEGVKRLWQEGSIPGEMHLSMGEEAIVVGIVSQLVDGDALALDHRATAPMIVRGIDPTLLLKEFMGRPDGLDGGMGGHMHLFSPGAHGSLLRDRRGIGSGGSGVCSRQPALATRENLSGIFWGGCSQRGNDDGIIQPGGRMEATGDVHL